MPKPTGTTGTERKSYLCPHCLRRVAARHFACRFARAGGQKSRRELTRAQAKAMVAKREQNRLQAKKKNPSDPKPAPSRKPAGK